MAGIPWTSYIFFIRRHRRETLVVLSLLLSFYFLICVGGMYRFNWNSESGLFWETDHSAAFGYPRNMENSMFGYSPAPKLIEIYVLSSRERVFVSIDGRTVVEDEEPGTGRGIHVVVLDGEGRCTSYRIFDTYLADEDSKLVEYLSLLPDLRIVIFAVKDEASSNLGKDARLLLSNWGSSDISWRDMWIFIAFKNGSSTYCLGETVEKSVAFSTWAAPAVLQLDVRSFPSPASSCEWPREERVASSRRSAFCSATDGYPDVCRCDSADSIAFQPRTMKDSQFAIAGRLTVPVAIIASNRPFYLKKMIQCLLNTTGVDPNLITVFVDGIYDEPVKVAKLYGLYVVQHIPTGHRNSKVSQHYKSTISAIFSLHSDADYAVIIEEDLLLAPDFFSFIAQTLPLLNRDPTLYCISAWNDLGYTHTVGDPRLLYRVETMPGLGWVVPRKLFKTELEMQWPSHNMKWDWDMWMRSPAIQQGRECIVPDISRTYHFGSTGLNMNPTFQQQYFEPHIMYDGDLVEFRDLAVLAKDEYENLIIGLLKKAVPVDHKLSPCDPNFFPVVPYGHTHLVCIRMDNLNDYSTWLLFCKCLRIWDLDARGSHKGIWRFHVNGNTPVFVVGVPASPYTAFVSEVILPIDLSPNRSRADVVPRSSTVSQL